jgi:hypothetical protein
MMRLETTVETNERMSFEVGKQIAAQIVTELLEDGAPDNGPYALRAIHIRQRHGSGSGLFAALLEVQSGERFAAYREVAPDEWEYCPPDERPSLERELDDDGGTTH